MEFIGTWLALSIAVGAAIAFVPGIEAVGGAYMGPVFTALALALVNATLKPIMQVLSLPLTIITLGIFALIVNAFVLQIAGWLSTNIFHAGIEIRSFGAAFTGAIIIAIVNMIVSGILGVS